MLQVMSVSVCLLVMEISDLRAKLKNAFTQTSKAGKQSLAYFSTFVSAVFGLLKNEFVRVWTFSLLFQNWNNKYKHNKDRTKDLKRKMKVGRHKSTCLPEDK